MGASSRTVYLNTFLVILVTLAMVEIWDDPDMLYRCVTISCICGNFLWQGYVFMAVIISLCQLPNDISNLFCRTHVPLSSHPC